MKLHVAVIICLLLLFANPKSFGQDDRSNGDDRTNGPYLGNGIRNGWADQDSIVIWTRTTKSPEMITQGPQFKSVDRKLEREIRQAGASDRYLAAQLPVGKALHQMLGACPGLEGRVRLVYYPQDNSNNKKTTDWKSTSSKSDFTAQWKLRNLEAGTAYTAIVETSSNSQDKITARCAGSFKTAPPKDLGQSFKFCVTTCHDFNRRDNKNRGHKIYPAMKKLAPDFVVHAGDIEYYDKPNPFAWTKQLMRFKWQRIFSLPDNREFYSTHTSYFIKDDHDTLKNDCWPGQSYGEVSFDEGVRLFNEEQFPSRSERYQTVRWGKNLQFWVLEGRDYRSPNNMKDGPDKTILGTQQKKWLKESLQASDAKFKLIFFPTPVVGPDRKNKNDNHANISFSFEGNELREFFKSIDGVILFCGDRHWQYASADTNSRLWEFGCGPGSDKHQLGWKKGDVRPSHKFLRVAAGFLSGELASERGKPTLTIRHHNTSGQEKSRFEFPSAWTEAK